jgi:hypothetical protein
MRESAKEKALETYNPMILSATEEAAQRRLKVVGEESILRYRYDEERLVRMSNMHPAAREVLNALVREDRWDIIEMLDDDNIVGADIWMLFIYPACSNISILISMVIEGRAAAALLSCPDSSFYREIIRG